MHYITGVKRKWTCKVVWSIIGTCLGACDRPNNLDKYWLWIKYWLLGNRTIHSFGLELFAGQSRKLETVLAFSGKN
jgi:hypothetical protein